MSKIDFYNNFLKNIYFEGVIEKMKKNNEDGYNKIVIAAMASIAARAVVLICCSMIFK